MTTVIAVYNSEGCVGRCDAKCHNATEPDCDCICGGRLHGVGAPRAVEVLTDWLDPDLELRKAFAAAHELDAGELRLEFIQPELPICRAV